MGLEKIFICPRALKRSQQGLFAPFLDGFVDWLTEPGFEGSTIRRHINHVSHWSKYLTEQGLTGVEELKDEHVTAFLDGHLPCCHCRRPGAFRTQEITYGVHRFLEYLKERNLMEPDAKEDVAHQKIQEEYLVWLCEYRNATEGTCNLRQDYLKVFLERIAGEKLATLSGEMVEQFFLEYSRHKGLAARRSMQATLRTFFSFCHERSYHSQDLGFAVPTLRTYRLNKVPRGIQAEEGLRVIAETKMDSAAGIRDHAIVQTLFTYGVRGGQVRALKLEDINWAQNEIRFAPLKQGKEVLQPLTREVGESILSYLEKARPRTDHREVFLTTRAPYRPLLDNALSEIVRRRMKASGIESPSQGAHVFRHTFATRMLAQGEPLKTIADMLGHRYLTTTYQYTLVDLRALNQVALDWPEVNP